MIQKYMALTIAGITIVNIIRALWVKRRRDEEEQHVIRREWYTVRLGDGYLTIGILGAVLSAAILIAAAWSEEEPAVTGAMAFFIFLSLSIILKWTNGVILYNEDNFIVKNIWGIGRSYSYEQITGVLEQRKSRIYIGKRIITIEEFSSGGFCFLELAKTKCREMYGSIPKPDKPYGRFDVFRGHVKNPEEILIVYIMMFVYLIGGVCFVCITFINEAYTEKNTEIMTLTFCRYDERKADLRLNSHDAETQFCIWKNRNVQEALERLKSRCDGQTTFTAYVTPATPKEEADYVRIVALKDEDGTEYLTFEQTNESQRKEFVLTMVFFAGVLIIWGLCVGVSVKTGRNPEKYSRRVRDLFFRNGELQ